MLVDTCAVPGRESLPLHGGVRLEHHQHLVVRRHNGVRYLHTGIRIRRAV
jgi:hypothetical protein